MEEAFEEWTARTKHHAMSGDLDIIRKLDHKISVRKEVGVQNGSLEIQMQGLDGLHHDSDSLLQLRHVQMCGNLHQLGPDLSISRSRWECLRGMVPNIHDILRIKVECQVHDGQEVSTLELYSSLSIW